jgi:hypothetical protein
MKKTLLFVLGAALWGGTPQVSAQDSVKTEAVVAVEDTGYNYNYAEDEAGDEVPDARVAVPERSSSASLLQGVSSEDFMENVMNAIVVFIVFASLTLIAFFVLFFRYRNKQAKYKLAAKALESGQPIPEELLGGGKAYARFEQPSAAGEPQAAQPAFTPSDGTALRKLLSVIGYLYNTNRNMRRGLNQLFLGLALCVFFCYAGWPDFFVGLSFLVMIIALGQMVAAYLESPKR